MENENENECNLNNIKSSDIRLKVLVLGDATIGKTSLITRYCTNEFQPVYITTIGIDKRRKNICVNNVQVKLIIWDTAGQEKFRALNKTFYKETDAVILAFDLNNKESIININYWMGQLYQEKNIEKIGLVLVGTKKDLLNDGGRDKVEKKEIEDSIQRYKIKYFETSSKTGEGVKEMFNYVIKLSLSKKNVPELPFNGNLECYQIKELNKGQEEELNNKEIENFVLKKKKSCCKS